MNKRRAEYTILFGATFLALGLALVVIRIFEPRLFGRPKDLEVVQLQREAPDFFSNALPDKDIAAAAFQVHDPITGVRGKPFFPEIMGLGPHDLLGFRNRKVPNIADIVVVGDSQTYGNNALWIDSWPNKLEKKFKGGVSLYSAAVGGWSLPQYFTTVRHLAALQPKQYIVAVYLGNDILETVRTIYSIEAYRNFRSNFDPASIPGTPSTLDEKDFLTLKLSHNHEVILTPQRRLLALDNGSPAIREGLRLTQLILTELSKLSGSQKVHILIALIPTKESIFADAAPNSIELSKLVAAETYVRNKLIAEAASYPNLKLFDLLPALVSARQTVTDLYPSAPDGHPLPGGYQVIAEAVFPEISNTAEDLKNRAFEVVVDDLTSWFYINNRQGFFSCPNRELLLANGWIDSQIEKVDIRHIAGLTISGVVTGANPEIFGPDHNLSSGLR